MKKEKKLSNFTFFVSRMAAVVVAVGGSATVTGCTTIFHEKRFQMYC